MSQEPTSQILTVKELLEQPMCIPVYQRPYKWTLKNVQQLLSDIMEHSGKSRYRLGTIVFFKNENSIFEIVDGQQRIVSLLLLVHALRKKFPQKFSAPNASFDKILAAMRFENRTSQENIYYNYRAICAYINSGVSEEYIDRMLGSCEVVCFTLKSISEAFQFFDSQNTRGQELKPHDLLKAYHLREIPLTIDNIQKMNIVEHWKKCGSEELKKFFELYLYRVRNWIRGESALYFTKKEVDKFKGFSLHGNSQKSYPYMHAWRALLGADAQLHLFPFQLDQPIINGCWFFKMVKHYVTRTQHACSLRCTLQAPDEERARIIVDELETYPGRMRTGDRYVHTLFICLLLAYGDRFGPDKFARAIEHCFIWAYRLRVGSGRVRMETVDKYVLENKLFSTLNAALTPEQFFAYRPAARVHRAGVKHLERVEKLLQDEVIVDGK